MPEKEQSMPDPNEERTAIPGSDPGDEGRHEPGAGPDGGQGGESRTPEEEQLPFDKHPKWIAARQAEKSLQEIMEANEVDTPEELNALIESGTAILGKGIDPEQIDELLAKAKERDEWVRYNEQRAELKRTEEETPEQTADRLRRENAKLKAEHEASRQAESSDRLLKSYDKAVLSAVEEALGKDASKEIKEFYAEFMGVNNPFASIDISDKRQVQKMTKDNLKKVEAFKQLVIKEHAEGKLKIPPVSPATTATTTASPRIDMRTARKALLERWRP
jgi:hypothetical protein